MGGDYRGTYGGTPTGLLGGGLGKPPTLVLLDVWTYFQQREREFDELSVAPTPGLRPMFAEEAGSDGQRGRIFGQVSLTDDAFLALSERVVVRAGHVHREEYAYFLVIDGAEVWGYERDLSHDPAVHKHMGPDLQRVDAEPISFKAVVELAWDEVSRQLDD